MTKLSHIATLVILADLINIDQGNIVSICQKLITINLAQNSSYKLIIIDSYSLSLL